MRVGIPAETAPGERRLALVPDGIGRLVKAGHEVLVQRGAGEPASIRDEQIAAAGAAIVGDAAAVFGRAEILAKVRAPTLEEVALMTSGAALVALLQPAANAPLLERLAKQNVTAYSLELVPRTTRAQVMDVLSSQATVAGYKAVLLGAAELGKLLPMLTTAAGTIAPSRVFIIGAGVAGLQAIATARRLGAIVSAFDARAAAREHVLSLGASFVATELASGDAETKGGYARAQTESEQARTAETLARHIAEQDLVITTAQIPGRPAPMLIPEDVVRRMKPGSVIVDMAAETGGNCALTKAGATVLAHGIAILGPLNLAATVPVHASQMLSKNIESFLSHIAKGGSLRVDLNDEIAGPMCVTHAGEVRFKSEKAGA
jgi:NAD(P) transhydrogenase subunit alpha